MRNQTFEEGAGGGVRYVFRGSRFYADVALSSTLDENALSSFFLFDGRDFVTEYNKGFGFEKGAVLIF